LPIDTTLVGIAIAVSAEAFLNALVPMDVTPFGITAVPEQLELPVTTKFTTVKFPEEQL
jgi:hypothetical protein